MDARHWRQCPTSLTHGNMIQRVIFTKNDPENPRAPGAILNHPDSFARAYLEPGVSSEPHVNEGIQEVFFVAGGAGTLACGGQEQAVREGDGIILPPGPEHTFRNDGDAPLELLIVVETVPAGAQVKHRSAFIRNYRESRLSEAHWSYLVHPLFTSHHALGADDGLTRLHSVLVVVIEPMRPGDTHGHSAGMDEVWYMWKGQGLHVVSRDVCLQTAGTAVSVAPSDPGHSLINHTTEPLLCFYFAHYG